MVSAPHIYIIAGEASGDFLGGRLLQTLHDKQSDIILSGIGGERMQQTGLTSLFPMQELALMGFAEVLPHLFRLKRRIRQTVRDILDKQPDIVITIDSPGFTFRVVRQLRDAGYKGPFIHYVAPTVWAYKPQRAAKTASLFDALMVLLPFEPPYFEKEGLKTHFTGHPVAWEWKETGDGKAFRARHRIAAKATVIGMFPGSRRGELRRHLPVFKETIARVHKEYPMLELVIPTTEAMAQPIADEVKHWPVPSHLVVGDTEKKDAYAACNIALAKAGTVSIETAFAGIPTITTFKTSWLSAFIVRRMSNISLYNLINIIRDEEIIPEYLQENCHPDILTPALLEWLRYPEKGIDQAATCRSVMYEMGAEGDISPSEKAAEVVLGML